MLLALALLLSAPVAAAPAAAAPQCPGKGSPAPRFNLPLARGGRISLTELLPKKRAAILSFWRFDCVPCVAELPELQKLVAAWGGRVSALAIHVGGPEEKMLAFLDDQKLALPVAIDGNPEAFSEKRYCVSALPQLLVLDSAGKVVATLVGAQPDFARSLRAAVEPLLRPGQ